MTITITVKEGRMATADFYIAVGKTYHWLGSIPQDGSPAEMDEMGLFGPTEDDGPYTENTFRQVVADVLSEPGAAAVGAGAPWPWNYPSSAGTDMVYVFKLGAVYVYERGTDSRGVQGQILVATHYPNGARNVTRRASEQAPRQEAGRRRRHGIPGDLRVAGGDPYRVGDHRRVEDRGRHRGGLPDQSLLRRRPVAPAQLNQHPEKPPCLYPWARGFLA
jgi:hypothetical protein